MKELIQQFSFLGYAPLTIFLGGIMLIFTLFGPLGLRRSFFLFVLTALIALFALSQATISVYQAPGDTYMAFLFGFVISTAALVVWMHQRSHRAQVTQKAETATGEQNYIAPIPAKHRVNMHEVRQESSELFDLTERKDQAVPKKQEEPMSVGAYF